MASLHGVRVSVIILGPAKSGLIWSTFLPFFNEFVKSNLISTIWIILNVDEIFANVLTIKRFCKIYIKSTKGVHQKIVSAMFG